MDSRAQKLWQRGIFHFRQGNMEAAQANFEAFLANEPGSGPALFRLSMVHGRRGRFQRAVELARAALERDPERVEVLAHLARCYMMCGQPEQARALATRALAAPRDNAVVLDSLGAVMTRLDEQVLAMELFDQAIALAPGQPSMYFNRALAHKQFDQVDAAQADLETCLALNPAHAKAHWTLAGLRGHDLGSHHLRRLRDRLALCARGSFDEELLALSLFKEADDLGDSHAAGPALLRGIESRLARSSSSRVDSAALTDAAIAAFDEKFCRPRGNVPTTSPAPVFVFGMPRAGVALLGSLLSRHPRIHHLRNQQAFMRLLAQALGQEGGKPLGAETLAQCTGLDLEALGRRYIAETCPAGSRQLLVCESEPMNYQLAGVIARALPGARLLHVTRDPLDNCVSILGHAGSPGHHPDHDPGELASAYLHYHRLMRHWQQVLPGRMMDVSYESLVEKPEMILRVVCSFLEVRYASSLRMGLQLHRRSIGRGQRYASLLPSLVKGLSTLNRRTRSA